MRRNEGRETITELTNWDRGQAASERLAGKILLSEGFEDGAPSHPAGGRILLSQKLMIQSIIEKTGEELWLK